MPDIDWYKIEDLYTVEQYKIKHNRKPKTKWVNQLPRFPVSLLLGLIT